MTGYFGKSAGARGSGRPGIAGCIAAMLVVSVAQSAERDAPTPASISAAAKVIDFRHWLVPEGSPSPRNRSLAQLSYETQADVLTAFRFQQQQLAGQKWIEQPQSYVSEQSASATFQRDGFTVSLSAFPGGQPGMSLVSLINHGNVDFKRLPLPEGTTTFYQGPASALFLSPASPKATAQSLQALLVKQGWEPYGRAGDQYFFRQNGVRLSASVSAAPAQEGKTMISLSSEQMSSELPAPPQAEGLQYADTTTELLFDTPQSREEIISFYRQTLAPDGWTSTTENPVKTGFREELIFANAAKDLLMLQMSTVEGKLRVTLRQQTAAQVAELDRAIKAEMDRKKAESSKPALKISLPLPAEIRGMKAAKNRIEFQVASGRARTVVEELQRKLLSDGWKAGDKMMEAMFGTLSLTKGDQQLQFVYVDPGLIPGEVTITASGVELETAAKKQE